MRFVDCVTIHTAAGHGGAGAVAFRREKFVAQGGPYGGNGGHGGSVLVDADENIGTLLDFRFRQRIAAQAGDPGRTKLADGKSGQDAVVKVPVGTIVRDAITGDLIADLSTPGQRAVVAAGGRGGLGNARFKTSVNQTPSYAQPGEAGEERTVTLELKLLADVGIVGFPSVGKSTLISVISNARPKIAAYPFTTLVPNLGLVRWHDYRSFVVADIPGIVEGAHEGRGLGYQFLRHVERCRALVHLIEVTPGEAGRDPIADFETLNAELRLFSASLARRPSIVALGKMDLPFVADREPELRAWFTERGHQFLAFSAATTAGIAALTDRMGRLAAECPPPDVAHFTVADPDARLLEELDAETGVEVQYVFESSD